MYFIDFIVYLNDNCTNIESRNKTILKEVCPTIYFKLKPY